MPRQIGFLARLRAYATVAARPRQRAIPQLDRLLARRPALLLGVGAFETAVLAANSVDARLKYLASLKASSLVGCPF